MTFALTRLRANDRRFLDMFKSISADGDAALSPARRWGAFFGLFGIASNELLILTVGDVEQVNDRLLALESVRDAETLLLEPTVRPISEIPISEQGLYVFRFFEVANRDVDEIAALSKQAWESFEATSDYSAEPKALFRQVDRSCERGRMLLLTLSTIDI